MLEKSPLRAIFGRRGIGRGMRRGAMGMMGHFFVFMVGGRRGASYERLEDFAVLCVVKRGPITYILNYG